MRNKKGMMEALNFIFFVIISLIVILVFVVGVNVAKEPNDFLDDTIKEADSNLLFINLLKYSINYQGESLEINEALLLYSDNHDQKLRAGLESNMSMLISQFYPNLCWKVQVEQNGAPYALGNANLCQIFSKEAINSEIFLPSRNGIIRYNLVIDK